MLQKAFGNQRLWKSQGSWESKGQKQKDYQNQKGIITKSLLGILQEIKRVLGNKSLGTKRFQGIKISKRTKRLWVLGTKKMGNRKLQVLSVSGTKSSREQRVLLEQESLEGNWSGKRCPGRKHVRIEMSGNETCPKQGVLGRVLRETSGMIQDIKYLNT